VAGRRLQLWKARKKRKELRGGGRRVQRKVQDKRGEEEDGGCRRRVQRQKKKGRGRQEARSCGRRKKGAAGKRKDESGVPCVASRHQLGVRGFRWNSVEVSRYDANTHAVPVVDLLERWIGNALFVSH
jgi:hypothetical protein